MLWKKKKSEWTLAAKPAWHWRVTDVQTSSGRGSAGTCQRAVPWAWWVHCSGSAASCQGACSPPLLQNKREGNGRNTREDVQFNEEFTELIGVQEGCKRITYKAD